MGRTLVVIPDELEKKFRMKVAEKYGGKKGSLGMAIEAAIRMWMEASASSSGDEKKKKSSAT